MNGARWAHHWFDVMEAVEDLASNLGLDVCEGTLDYVLSEPALFGDLDHFLNGREGPPGEDVAQTMWCPVCARVIAVQIPLAMLTSTALELYQRIWRSRTQGHENKKREEADQEESHTNL